MLPSFICVFLLALKATEASFSPPRISFESFVRHDDPSEFLRALQEVGMISITGIPHFESKVDMLKYLPQCMDQSSLYVDHRFPDGTLRKTLAAHSANGGTGMKPPAVGADAGCEEFLIASKSFQQVVTSITESFGEYLTTVLRLDADPNFQTIVLQDEHANHPGYALMDIIQQGEQLDHFHCYYKESVQAEETIEWHTDQGMALVFAPGAANGKTTDGFFIQLADGSTEMVDFDAEVDDLVILLGDGVNQYLNHATTAPLRALPHALRMSTTFPNEPRVWYGRMMLPPATAVHPSQRLTFENIRNQMIMQGDGSTSVGCSGDLVARELQETTCGDEGAYCWHRCMNYTDYEVSPEICEDQERRLACINSDGELWDEETHNPAFAIGCTDLSNMNDDPMTNSTDDDMKGEHEDDHDDHDHDHDDHDHDHSGEVDVQTLNKGDSAWSQNSIVGLATVILLPILLAY